MKLFGCDLCGQTLYFENHACVSCGATLGYVPELGRFLAARADQGGAVAFTFTSASGETRGYLPCNNAHACNWLREAPIGQEDAGKGLCRSCELTEVTPDLADPTNDAAWRRIESAKRRLLYSLFALRLPVESRQQSPAGLAFRFLKGTPEEPVMTGHADGVITLNVDEAQHAFRENMREKMGEGYRTVLGHLRHEIGHYYWDRLIANSDRLEQFRRLFGDERADYQEAIDRHYGSGPPADWGERFISAYASMHPWEDWAETWAHYLHMVDTLETARSHGLALKSPVAEAAPRIATSRLAFVDFDALTAGWTALTLALNSLNRSMGLEDAYPFVLTPPVLAKLRFVHDLIHPPEAETGAAETELIVSRVNP